ncbi:MAG: hypothetical protein ACE5OR_03295, partial [bacterium]
SDYRFPPAPDKPTLTAVPGDGKVTLYWDRKAEYSFDPVLKVHDFEGYKIYRATDQNFNDVFQITDVDGTKQGYVPIAQFDLDNGISGIFQPGPDLYQQARGYSFNLGDDTGLKHSYVDEDVENGRRYFYAVVAYDRGDEAKDIFPAENDMRIDILPTGEIVTFQNTAVVVPRAEVIGYVPPEGSVQLDRTSGPGTGTVYYNVLHDSEITGHRYRLEFFDTSNDGLDNDGDWDVLIHDVGSDGDPKIIDPDGSQGNGRPDPGEPNVDGKDVEELVSPITTSYSVRDLTGITESFVPNDTNFVRLEHSHLIDGTITVLDDKGDIVPSDSFEVDLERGRIRGVEEGTFPSSFERKNYTISFQYYPVHRSPYMEKSPYVAETFDTDIFDGISLSFNNHWSIDLIDSLSGWADSTKAYDFSFAPLETQIGDEIIRGVRHPSDYEIQFFDEIVDTSSTLFGALAVPVNFKIYDLTDSAYIDFIFVEIFRDQQLSPNEEIVFLVPGPGDSLIVSWDMFFTSRTGTTYTFGAGDKLTLKLTKPFRRGDVFEFLTERPIWDESAARGDLDGIKVVPNPYVVATAHEPPLPPGVTSGRGTRRIEFRHLPPGAKIYIFTSRGEHVVTLHHDENIYDGTVAWNLKTKENLDIAYGVYFYVVESSVGIKRGKIAIIK